MIYLTFSGWRAPVCKIHTHACACAQTQGVKLTMRLPVLQTYLRNHLKSALKMDFLTQFLVFLQLEVLRAPAWKICSYFVHRSLPLGVAVSTPGFAEFLQLPKSRPLVITYTVTQMLLKVKHSGSSSVSWGDSSYFLFTLSPPSSS